MRKHNINTLIRCTCNKSIKLNSKSEVTSKANEKIDIETKGENETNNVITTGQVIADKRVNRRIE